MPSKADETPEKPTNKVEEVIEKAESKVEAAAKAHPKFKTPLAVAEKALELTERAEALALPFYQHKAEIIALVKIVRAEAGL